MSGKQYLTAEGAVKLKEELEHLTTVKRTELAQRLRSAIEMGDLSENADYIAAKEEQGFLEGKILELTHTLKNAEIISDDLKNGDEVSVGSTVTIQEDDFPTEIYQLVGSKEADPRNGRISNESPIGKALLGQKKGDKVLVETPNGSIQFKIISIE